jgi:hypothetical protein
MNYINDRINTIKKSKRTLNNRGKDYVFLSDQKNGIVCHYSEENKGIEYCAVSETLPIREAIVKDVIVNFWDSQPEFYRDFYEDIQ